MWSSSEPIYETTAQSTAKAWRERHGRYRLVGVFCETCDMKYYPRRAVCPKCRSRNLISVELSQRGKGASIAWDYSPLMGYGELIPNLRALIQLEDHGPCVQGDIIEYGSKEVKEGTPVEAVVRKLKREKNGNYLYGTKFRPI